MNITDLFIRRPVLPWWSPADHHRGLQAIRTLNVPAVPAERRTRRVTVTTRTSAPSANLVRGFITSPLERAIAAADGIDYMESQSASGFPRSASASGSTTIHEGPGRDRFQGGPVRRDLPPEAEVPIINIESADSRFASAYLSFSSGILQAERESPTTSCASSSPAFRAPRVCSGPKSSAPAPSPCASGSSPTGWRRRTSARRRWRQSSLPTISWPPSGGARGVHPGQPYRRHQPEHGGGVPAPGSAGANGTVVRLGDIADVVLGAEDYDAEVHFSGRPRCSWEYGPSERQLPRRHQEVRTRWSPSTGTCRPGSWPA